jgi:hypothetical protein
VPSLTQAEFNTIRTKYADLNLSASLSSYHVIEIVANELSDATWLHVNVVAFLPLVILFVSDTMV